MYQQEQLVYFESRLFRIVKIEGNGTLWIMAEHGVQIIRLKDNTKLKPLFA